MPSRLRSIAVAAGVAASLFFGYLAVRDVDYDVFADTIADTSYWWIAPFLAVLAASVAIRVVRWLYLFPPATRPPARAATRALLVGELFNVVLPFRAGELIRVVALHREARTSRPEALATTVVERILDVLVLLLLLLVVLPFAPEISWVGTAVGILAAVALVLLVGVLVLWRYQARPLSFLLRPLGWLPGFSPARTATAAESVLRGFRGLRHARAGGVALLLSAAGWLMVAFSYWLAMRGLGLELGYDAALLVAVATTFSFAIPSLPASLGVFEAATVAALDPFAVDRSTALGYAVVLHVASFAPFVVAGLVALRMHPAGRLRLTRERTDARPV